jgi:predicted glycosyltransferase
MVDIWLDSVTPKDSLLLSPIFTALRDKGYKTLITAKKQTQTTDILDLLGIPYTCIGKYGETLKEKLVEEQKRTIEFVRLFDKTGYPNVLWTHGDVGAIRTAFGLQIPIVYSNDTPHAVHVARLVSPLVDWLIAPISYGKWWSKFGISKSQIILYDGVEELAWMAEPKKQTTELPKEIADKKPLVLFRNAEYKASYCKDIKVDAWRVIEELSKTATIVYLPRYDEERKRLKDTENVWVPEKAILAFQIMPAVDLMVGSGGTICRESALLGIPTLNFHFWDAIARYLGKKGFPIQRITDTERILRTAKKILKEPKKHRVNTNPIIKKLENPVPLTVQYIEKYLKK